MPPLLLNASRHSKLVSPLANIKAEDVRYLTLDGPVRVAERATYSSLESQLDDRIMFASDSNVAEVR